MPEPIKLTLPYPPSANRYWRTRGYVAKKTGKAGAINYVSEEAKQYKKDVCALFLEWKTRNRDASKSLPMSGAVGYKLAVYRPQDSGDLSNRIKVLEDVLAGLVYFDDKQITKIEAERFDDPKNPRVEIEIYSKAVNGQLF